ncbi:MAG: Ig-like domain-containing protein [Bacilli bacterium]|nr:Ig-like domain-containing protein [Bacilli bacterium]
MKRKGLLSLLPIFLCLSSCSILFGADSSSEKNNETTSIRPHVERSYSVSLEVLNDGIVFTNTGAVHYQATVIDQDGKDVSEDVKGRVSWQSSDKKVISVNYDGAVSGLKEGSATITATFEGSSASVSLKSKVMAKDGFELTKKYVQMYKGETSKLPYSCPTRYASVEVEIENKQIVSLNESNCLESEQLGTSKVTLYTYEPSKKEKAASYEYEMVAYEFQAMVVPDNSPYFMMAGEKVTEGEASVAKNKYTVLNYKDMGISAYDQSEFNLMPNITVKEGEYDLSEIGTYKIVLEVNDGYGMSSIFNLTLNVTEYENKGSTANNDSVIASITTGNDANTYSAAFQKITLDASFVLSHDFDEANINIHVSVDYDVYEYQHGTPYSGHKTFHLEITPDGYRTASISTSFFVEDTHQSYTISTARVSATYTVTGKVYTHIYYQDGAPITE